MNNKNILSSWSLVSIVTIVVLLFISISNANANTTSVTGGALNAVVQSTSTVAEPSLSPLVVSGNVGGGSSSGGGRSIIQNIISPTPTPRPLPTISTTIVSTKTKPKITPFPSEIPTVEDTEPIEIIATSTGETLIPPTVTSNNESNTMTAAVGDATNWNVGKITLWAIPVIIILGLIIFIIKRIETKHE